MTNEFLVKSREILLLDESDFIAHGGEGIQFGHLDGEVVPCAPRERSRRSATSPASSSPTAPRPADPS